MKTILVPTDFSKEASNALNFAILLAQKIQAKLVLLSAYPIPVLVAEVPFDVYEEVIENQSNEVDNKLRAECEKIKHAGGVAYEYYSRGGDATDAIVNFTQTHHFDYIIMGTKGAGKRKTTVFGSTTSRLMAKTNIPVIAIPGTAHFSRKIHKITFATNYALTDVAAIAELSNLAAAFGAQVNVLHISENEESAAKRSKLMKEFMNKVNAETEYNNLSFQIMAAEDPEKRLEEYIGEDDADMIVMSTHLRNALGRLLGGSLTKRVALKTKIPLIVFHHQKEVSLQPSL